MATTIYRMTISIPQRLKEQMDALEVPVNWSALAAQAFQAKVNEVANRRMKEMTKQEVIARLKATDAQEDYEAGKQAGRNWAQRKPNSGQLRRAYDFVRSVPKAPYVAWWDVDDPGWGAQSGPPDNFASAVLPSRGDEPEATRAFWEAALGEEADRAWEASFLKGFGEGAAEVWEEVRGEL